MKETVQPSEMPMGLGMALAMNTDAMKRFSAMNGEEQRAVIEHTREINSKSEMREYVRRLAGGTVG